MLHIESLTTTYQRKMWKSMISRKKLDINIWDVLEYKKEKVFYKPYNAYQKFEVKTRYCRKCEKELEIGFGKGDFTTLTCKCSKDNKNYATMEKLTTLFSEEKAKEVLKTFAEYKTRKLPNKLRYWLDQGYSNEEAEIKVIEEQTKRSKKSPASKKGMTEYTCRRPEFWIKRGYNEEEAKQKVSEYQVGNGLEWYIKKYGEDKGKKKFNKRISTWMNKMTDLFMGVSKVSVELFEAVDEKEIGKYGKHETTVRGKNKVYRVDYLDKKQRKIIEFYGEYWHADPNKFNKDDLVRNTPAYKIWERDDAKIKDLQSAGYKVLVIKERDYYINMEKVLNECKEFLNEN